MSKSTMNSELTPASGARTTRSPCSPGRRVTNEDQLSSPKEALYPFPRLLIETFEAAVPNTSESGTPAFGLLSLPWFAQPVVRFCPVATLANSCNPPVIPNSVLRLTPMRRRRRGCSLQMFEPSSTRSLGGFQLSQLNRFDPDPKLLNGEEVLRQG
jgi:hypothetical protein